jgi:hypothetical protein
LVIDLPGDIKARVCTVRTCFPYSQKPFCRAGIETDILVKQTIDDYFNQKNVVMETAVHYLQQRMAE